MMKIRNITGIKKGVLNIKVKIYVFFFFLGEVLSGRLAVRRFPAVLRRLAYFLKKLQENKFVEIDGKKRLGLYVPSTPSKAFRTACKKFAVFGEKLPNTTVLLSITSACKFKCRHCYQKYDRGHDLDIETLVEVTKKIQDNGTAFFNLEGGEPFIVFDRLMEVFGAIDDRSEIWINSTGDGMSVDRLRELKDNGLTAVMFPLHSLQREKTDDFMGSKRAWRTIHEGIAMCHEAGVPVALNMCLSKEDFYDGTFEEMMDKAKALNAAIVQVIKPKPAGGWLESGASEFNREDLGVVRDKVLAYNQDKKYEEYPAISAQVMEEAPQMFGCTAGGTDRFYLNAKGDVQACEFLNLSFGNVKDEDFNTIFESMRQVFEVPGQCWLCERYAGEIHKIFQDNELSSLPLSNELSREIYENWDPGEQTELYDVVSRKMV